MKHLVLFAALLVGCGPTYHATLDDGAGLVEDSPVLVSSVRVGKVESVRVVEGHVEVAFSIDRDHDVTLRTDACAIGRRAQNGQQAALIVVPGTGAMREDQESPIAQCRIEANDVGDLMRSLGEGMGDLMRGLGRSLFPNGAPQIPTVPSPVPMPAPTVSDPCSTVHFRIARVEPVALPHGGHRVWLDVSNAGETSMQIGSASEATFTDDARRAFTVADVPGGPEGWHLPFDVAAHASRRVNVVLASDDRGTPRISDIEVMRSAPNGDPSAECTIHEHVQ
jgi:hypothetical protein